MVHDNCITKKNTSHINELINQFKQLDHHLKTERGLDSKIEFPTMILDDEADYASQNTDTEGEGSTIHEDLINLRKSIQEIVTLHTQQHHKLV